MIKLTPEQRETNRLASVLKYSTSDKGKATRKRKREERKTGGWFVYYIPSIHYCGITKDLYSRESYHRTVNGTDTDGLRVLYHSMNGKDAAYHEALFQATLGMEGLNVKLN